MPAGRANACPMTAEAILNWSIPWRRACMGRTSRSRRNYYCRSHARMRFHQLDGWIIRRLWSHRAIAEHTLEGISDHTAAHRVQAGRAGLTSGRDSPFMKAGCGKTARPVCAADGGQRKSNRARLLRPDTCEATEQGRQLPAEVVEGRPHPRGTTVRRPRFGH
jgi:hypothetical protein